ncbi:MAG: 50S ribosomal protein L15 [Dehalococcoidia bacterium]|nr:50S ribosomal protein L15 [Dehalococcoidia bacterium]
MRQHEIPAPPGAHKHRRRVGRGDGSGRGSYSGKGRKGQQARKNKQNPGFEGNQLPLVQRAPTLGGFTNHFRREYAIVNLGELDRRAAPDQPVTPDWLFQAGLVKDRKAPVKVLADGALTKPLQVSAHRFSASARQKIQEAGGSAVELPLPKRSA